VPLGFALVNLRRSPIRRRVSRLTAAGERVVSKGAFEEFLPNSRRLRHVRAHGSKARRGPDHEPVGGRLVAERWVPLRNNALLTTAPGALLARPPTCRLNSGSANNRFLVDLWVLRSSPMNADRYPPVRRQVSRRLARGRARGVLYSRERARCRKRLEFGRNSSNAPCLRPRSPAAVSRDTLLRMGDALS